MKLTKRMENLIDKRTKLANQLMDVCQDVDNLIEELGLEDVVDSSDWSSGCEIYSNPDESGDRLKNVIKNYMPEGDKVYE